MSRRTPLYRGFTLVELLVVIGIIALLISILLPALNRARASALSLDCQARMRQMGQAIHLYSTDHNGLLPVTEWENTEADFWKRTSWQITATLSGVLGTKDPDIRNLHPIFQDHDVNSAVNSWNSKVLNGYNFNLAMFPNRRDAWVHGYWQNQGKLAPLMKITKIRPAAEVVAAWDGGVTTIPTISWGGHAHYQHSDMHDNAGGDMWYYSNFDANTNSNLHTRPVGRFTDYPEIVGMVDFRHQDRATANVLFLDGHVEGRRYGELYVRDFVFRWK